MPLTSSEEARLKTFYEARNVPDNIHHKVRKIAELSKDGYSVPLIQKRVGGDTNVISEFRMKLRRAGVW